MNIIGFIRSASEDYRRSPATSITVLGGALLAAITVAAYREHVVRTQERSAVEARGLFPEERR